MAWFATIPFMNCNGHCTGWDYHSYSQEENTGGHCGGDNDGLSVGHRVRRLCGGGGGSLVIGQIWGSVKGVLKVLSLMLMASSPLKLIILKLIYNRAYSNPMVWLRIYSYKRTLSHFNIPLEIIFVPKLLYEINFLGTPKLIMDCWM